MSQRAIDFVHMWISANVHSRDFIYERPAAKSKEYAVECRKHAAAIGILSAEIKESFDDLEITMVRAAEKVVGQESGRSAHEDD